MYKFKPRLVNGKTFQLTTIVIGYLILSLNQTSAKTSQQRQDIVIYGKFSHVMKTELQEDMKFEVYRELYGAIDTNLNKTYHGQFNGDSFKVVIKPNADYVYFFCRILPVESLAHLFMAQPGDTLYLDIQDKNTYSLKSNNQELYLCQMELNNANVLQNKSFKNGEDGYINYINRRRDTVIKSLNTILDKYDKRLTPQVLRLIRINYLSNLNETYVGLLRTPSMAPDFYKKADHDAALLSINRLYTTNRAVKDTFLIRNSIYYAKYLFELEKLWNDTKCGKTDFKQERFERIYKSININYEGLLKEKLLSIFFLKLLNNSANAVTYLNLSIPQTHDSVYKQILLSLQMSKSAGNDAFPFSLEGESGKMYSLADFKGKVVICKFWFTGCGACAQEEGVLRPLKNKYKNNPKVIFVSVNVDYSKTTWEKGLKQGIYSSPLTLNLYTNGLGVHHPMLAFYQYTGFPQLLLIDKKGKLISSSPVRPTDDASLSKFDELIQPYLQ